LAKKDNLSERLSKIDNRVIFLLLAICLGLPLLIPIGLPLGISTGTSSFYKYVEGLPSGSLVACVYEISASVSPEVYPQAVAVTAHLKSRNLKIVALGFSVTGPMFADNAFRDVFGASREHELYGKSFVNLGYIAGGEAAMKVFATNPRMVEKDFYGRDTKDMQILQEVSSPKDFKLMIVYSGDWMEPYVRQFGDPHGVPIASGVTSTIVPRIMAFYPAKIKGYLTGLRGAAEYELLVKRPGSALGGMDAQSAAHLLIIGLVIAGNAGYLVGRFRRKEA